MITITRATIWLTCASVLPLAAMMALGVTGLGLEYVSYLIYTIISAGALGLAGNIFFFTLTKEKRASVSIFERIVLGLSWFFIVPLIMGLVFYAMAHI